VSTDHAAAGFVLKLTGATSEVCSSQKLTSSILK